MTEEYQQRVREICLSLPDTVEKITWGEPTFRVRNRIFTMFGSSDGIEAIWCKSETELRDALIGADPIHYFSPPYVGHKGWIGIRLDQSTDWDGVGNLIEESYLLVAANTKSKKRTLKH